MLLGFPWALMSWQGESWWWSGKVNMSIMMWLLYTAYLHARLYLRTKGMWKAVAIIVFATTAVSSIIFQSTTFALPKVFDERLQGIAGSATMLGWFAFMVFAVASMGQLIVGHFLEGVPIGVVVLGGAHDLSDKLPASCEYIRVRTRQCADAVK